MAQDDYYYEIQLTNKQLVFYFMAGATGLILSFLAGVMVGRGVDSAAGDVHASKPVQEEKIVAEEPVRPAPSPVEDLTYAQRLESEKTDVTLERPKPAASAASTAVKRPVAKPSAAKTTPPPAKPAPATAPTAAPAKPAAVKPAAAPSSAPPAAAHGGSFTIQVGAFKDRASADRVIGRLKSKGFPAYLVAPEAEGLLNVRVGGYESRADAERVQARLRDEEKFKPFIVKK